MELLVLLIFFHLILDISSQNQKPILSVAYDDMFDEFKFACEIPRSESLTADFSCNLYFGENLHHQQQVSKKSNSGKTACTFTALSSEVFNRLQSGKSYEASCDYSLTSDSTARSPISDKYHLTRFFPTLTHPNTTEKSAADVRQPRLKASPDVLTERESGQLQCEVPHPVKASQCIFYPEGQYTKTRLSASCQLSVTGSELIRWTARSSPGKLQMICYYTVDKSGLQTPSRHSHGVTVTVLNQKLRLRVSHDDQLDQFTFLCEIFESVTSEISCNLYTGENPQLFMKTHQESNSGKTACKFTAHRNDVFNSLQSAKSYEASCDYSLNSDSTARSSMSDKYTLTHFFLKTTQLPTTKKSTTDLRRGTTPPSVPTASSVFFWSSPVSTRLITTKHTTTQTSASSLTPMTTTTKSTAVTVFNGNSPTGENPRLQILMLSVLSVCVSLAGIICFCLCCFIKKLKAQRRKVDMTHGDGGVMASMLNLNLSGLDATVNYSLINSVPLSSIPLDLRRGTTPPSVPTDPSGDGKKDSKKTEDNVYHVYCSISDTQPVTIHKDKAVYSLVHAH